MKISLGMLFLAGVFGFVAGPETPSTDPAAATPVGLEIGQHVPAFKLPDQFGHKQSNETLKGSKGTILLFFRSADW